ncbi:MAG: sigma-70 family RNA polymerase sigma factor [Cellulomonas sp.]|nr:sigma-70 family RNA polymerase sigma factor [Cellulomonas sp.]
MRRSCAPQFLKQGRSGDEISFVPNPDASIDALVTANLPLVGYHVSELLGRVPSYVSRDDLASAGSLALVRAAQAFDVTTGVPFARYAALRIRGALLDELRSMDWVSRGARQRARRVTTTRDELTSQFGRTPSREELAATLGTTVAEVDAARGDADRRILSIEAFDSAIADTVSEPSIGPEETLLVNEKLQHLRAAVTSLPERLKYVVEQLFFEDRPVVDLADELGVTQSRISQLRTEALALMKDGMNASLEPTLVRAADRPDGVAERRRKAYFELVAQQASFLARASQLASPGPGRVPSQRPETVEADAFLLDDAGYATA